MPAVYHVTKSLVGGGGVYAQRLSTALNALNRESRVLCAENASLKPENGLPFQADRVLAGVLNRRTLTAFHTFLRQREWAPANTLNSGDIVHLHSITGFIGSRGLRRLIPSGAKVFWTAHNPWLFTGGCVAYEGCDRFELGCRECPILRFPLKRWTRFEYEAKNSFWLDLCVNPIANSRWMAGMLKKSPIFASGKDIPIVPPIVDDVFSYRKNRCQGRMEFGIADDRFVIGLSARALTDTGKGIDRFFQRLPEDSGFLKRTTFILIGDGHIEIPEGVDCRMLGHVASPAKLSELYGMMDLFVSPSFMESFGMALLEAQACGTPVIAFETGGTPEAVCPVENCRLVPNGDFRALYGEIDRSFESQASGQAAGKDIAEWVSERHGWRSIAEKQIAIYEETASPC